MIDIQTQLESQDTAKVDRQVLITDIDNTFYRADSPTAIDAAWQLRKRCTANQRPIIAVTGNHYPDVQQRIDSGELPQFEVIVGSVGTEIWYLHDGIYIPDATFEEQLQNMGYVAKRVIDDAAILIKKLATTLPTANLSFQKNNSTYKTSLHFFAANQQAITAITSAFANQFPSFKIITCEEIHYNATLASDDQHKRYCLDIVPSTKADAVNYLIDAFDIKQGIIAGDSGNDSDMLMTTPDSFVSVAVGGCKNELRDAIMAVTTDNGMFRRRGNKWFFVDTANDRKAAETLLFIDDYLQRQ